MTFRNARQECIFSGLFSSDIKLIPPFDKNMIDSAKLS